MSSVDPFAGLRVRCTRCRPRLQRAYRKPDDPPSVCRCGNCGKKHSTDTLEAVSR